MELRRAAVVELNEARQQKQPSGARESTDEGALPKELLSDSKLGGALRKQLDAGLYDEAELKKARDAEAAERREAEARRDEGPPREWVLERMREALERQRASRGDEEPVAKGYRRTTAGGETPAWSAPPAGANSSDGENAAAKPVRVAGNPQPQPQAVYNRGYKEVDVSVWCRRRLLARLRSLQAGLVDPAVRDGRAGVVRCTPVEVDGDALLVRVCDRWDRAYDLSARFSFEARVGSPRTREVELKDKKQRMFMGVPTVRGAVVVRELTHVEGPREAIVELQWGYGGTEMHFEKDEIGMTKEHAKRLRAFLLPPERESDGTVHSAVVEMLERFVEDFETHIPGQPSREWCRPFSARLAPMPLLSSARGRTRGNSRRRRRRRRGFSRRGSSLFCRRLVSTTWQAVLGVETLLPTAVAIAPWRWEKPEAPKTSFDVAPGSK